MPALNTLRAVLAVARDRDIPFLAAAIAHYTLASLVPLALLAVALAALVGSEAAIEGFIRERLGQALTAEGQEVLTRILTSTEGATGAGVVSVLLAFWSGSKVFRGLTVAFAEIYDVESSRSPVARVRDAAIVVGLLATSIGAMIAIGVVISVVELTVPFQSALGTATLFLTLLVGLLPIYYVLTPVRVSVGHVLPGVGLSAVGLVALQIGFVVYSQYAGQYEALGVLGALLLFVIWLYFGGIVVLLGGALNYVLATGPVEQDG